MWITSPGMLNHPRRQIDSAGIDSSLGQVRGDDARSTPDIQDGPEITHRFGEGIECRPEPRVWPQVAHAHVDILVGDRVVGPADDIEVGWLHGTTVAREPDTAR